MKQLQIYRNGALEKLHQMVNALKRQRDQIQIVEERLQNKFDNFNAKWAEYIKPTSNSPSYQLKQSVLSDSSKLINSNIYKSTDQSVQQHYVNQLSMTHSDNTPTINFYIGNAKSDDYDPDSSQSQSQQQQQQTNSSSSSPIQSSSTSQKSPTTSNNYKNAVLNIANVPSVAAPSLSVNNKVLQRPSTTIARGPRLQSRISPQYHHVNQISMARKANNQTVNVGGVKPDVYDPNSNVYVANLPGYEMTIDTLISIHHPIIFCLYIINRDYGKKRLYTLFCKYGQIMRYKFVAPDEPSQPGYGLVQFAYRKDAHQAIESMSCIAFIIFMHELSDDYICFVM